MYRNDFHIEYEAVRNEWVVGERHRGNSGSYWAEAGRYNTEAEAKAYVDGMVQWYDDQRAAHLEAYLCGYHMGRVSEYIARMKVESDGEDFDAEYAKRLPEYEAITGPRPEPPFPLTERVTA